MRLGRMIAAGTVAVGAYRAFKEFKGEDEPQRGRFGRSRKPQRSRGGLLHRH